VLASVLRGHLAYYAVPGNVRAVDAFRFQLVQRWLKALRRRSQRHRLNWQRMLRWLNGGSHRPGSCTPTGGTLCRQDLRQEPSAVIPHAGSVRGPPARAVLPQPGLLSLRAVSPCIAHRPAPGPVAMQKYKRLRRDYQKAWHGSTLSASESRSSSSIGTFSRPPTTGLQEPYEPRGSRTVP